MGEHLPRSFSIGNIMKALILVSLVLSVIAEPDDPTLVHHPNGAVVPADTPEVVAAKALHFGAHATAYAHGFKHPGYYGYYGFPYVWGRKKREAEAEADPLYYGYPYAYAGYYGYPYAYQVGYHGWGVKNGPCVNSLNQAVPCAQEGEARKKRESDPAYFAVPTAVAHHATPYGLLPVATGHALVHPSHYGVCTNYLGQQVSC